MFVSRAEFVPKGQSLMAAILTTFAPNRSIFDGKVSKYRQTIKSGFLTKSPRRRHHRIGRWQRRWFVLVGSIVCKPGMMPERYVWLEYFKVSGNHKWSRQQPPVLKGMLDLRSCLAVVPVDNSIRGYEYIFSVVTKNEVHYFSAESEKDRQDWIEALNDFLFSKNMFIPQHNEERVVVPSSYLDLINTSCTCHHFQFQRSTNSIIPVSSTMMVQGNEPEAERHHLKLRLSSSTPGADNASGRPKLSQSNQTTRWMGSYEEPQKDDHGLYLQLAGFGFRNIPRDQIKQDTPIPSCGKFLCYNGTTSSSEMTYQVFLKTAKDNTGTTNILQEAAILAQLYHPNVIKLLGTVLVGHPKMTVLELCTKGNLRERLLSLKTGIDVHGGNKMYDVILLDYCRQITLGMHYLSERGFVHKSLKAKHILVTEDDKCKISGFADSITLENNQSLLKDDSLGISKWTAPEVLSDGNYTVASTVWSLGVVMYEIWSLGNEPYAGLNANIASEVLQKINAGYRLPSPQRCPKLIYNIMKSCWQREPALRPGYNYLVKYLLQQESYLLDLSIGCRHSKSDTQLPHTTQRHSYYNAPSSKLLKFGTRSELPSIETTPTNGQHEHKGLRPKFFKSESVPAPDTMEDDSDDEDDYTTEMSTILEIRSKSATNLSNRYNCITLPLNTTTTGRWTYFFDDSDDESECECESPYQNYCKTLSIPPKPCCSSTEKTSPQQHVVYTQNGTETPQPTESLTANVSYPILFGSCDDTPTSTAAHDNLECDDQYRERRKPVTGCKLTRTLPLSHSGGLYQGKEVLYSEESSAEIATMKPKVTKPPVPTPRDHLKQNSLPMYYNYNQQKRLLTAQNHQIHHLSTPTVTVQGEDSSSSPDDYETIKSYDPEIWHLLASSTDSQTSLNNHYDSDGYEHIQRYEILTHTMTIEEFSLIAQQQQQQQQRRKMHSGYLSL